MTTQPIHKDCPAKDALTMKHLVAFISVFGLSILGAAVAWGQIVNKVDTLQASDLERRQEIHDTAKSIQELQRDVATLQNDVEWNNRTLELIAQKLSVTVPSKGKGK